MKILVIGSGGREHALIWALQRNATRQLELFCAPGNAGIAQIARCVPIGADDVSTLAAFAGESGIDLTMVGPEAPLAAGIVDEFKGRGLRIVGPGRAAARLESSKAFAKDFMRRHEIPTARYRIASSAREAVEILQGGDDLQSGPIGSKAARRIVIEEVLSGREVSLLLFSDGKDFRLMPAARDHKRVGEGDTGPNTGGMGSITDASVLDDATRDRIVREIVEPTLQGCREEGFPFRGILFIGLMLTNVGPQVLEYNVRFGDPETQAILVRLNSDLSDILQAIDETRLGDIDIDWSQDSSACVVLAAPGYPAKPETGALIRGLASAEQHEGVAVLHAATARNENGEWLTAGGRVLGITATGENLNLALSRCYEAVDDISWDGMHYRRDIGRPRAPGVTAGS